MAKALNVFLEKNNGENFFPAYKALLHSTKKLKEKSEKVSHIQWYMNPYSFPDLDFPKTKFSVG